MPVSSQKLSSFRKHLLYVMHLMIIALSVILLYAITYDTLSKVSFLTDRRYLNLQFWICMFFLVETVVEWIISPDKLRRLPSALFLVIVCVPYVSLIHEFHWHVSLEIYYILRLMPLVRAVAVLMLMFGLIERNWITGMFSSYLIILAMTLYVLSLMFYVEAHPVNAQVYDYWQSLWYALMQMNTCGSNISPLTPAGKIIGVILSIEGLIVFPVFTVFFTHAFGRIRQTAETTSRD